MDPVTDVLNRAVAPDDQGLGKVGLDTFTLGVDADQVELLPAALDDVLDAQVHLARHDDGVGLARELIEEVERHRVDLVVDVQALDVLAVVLHDDVDEVVDGHVLVADEDLAVEDLVVAQDVHDHLLVQPLGRGLEGDFHAAGFFGFEVDVSVLGVVVVVRRRRIRGMVYRMGWDGRGLRWLPVESDADSLQFGLQQRPLLGLLGRVQHHKNEIAGLGGRDDLPSSALALGGTLDDTGKIEQLDLGAAVLEHTGNRGQGCECI